MDEILYSWTTKNYQYILPEIFYANIDIYHSGDILELDMSSNAFILILDGKATFVNNDPTVSIKQQTSFAVQTNLLLFSSCGCYSKLLITSSLFKCFVIRFQLYGVPNSSPNTAMPVLNINRLRLQLPKRINLQPMVEPYPLFLKIMDEIQTNFQQENHLMIHSLLTEIIIRLLRDNSPENTQSVNRINGVCFSSFCSKDQEPI